MSTAISAAQAIVLAPGEGKSLSILGNNLVFKVTGQDSDGEVFVMEYTAPAGFPGPPPHVHAQTDEVFYVLSGSIAVLLADRTVQADAGSFVFVPRGVPHTFANRGETPATFLAVMTPAGFEGYFEELAALVPPGASRPDPAAGAALAGKYDQVPASLSKR